MEPLEKQKLERQAVNGKRCLMFGGIFLIFSALTSTLIYGMGYFLPALEANKGNQEYQELLETNGLQSSLLMGIGICYLLMAVWEVAVGFNCAKNSNRVDRSRFTKKLVLALLIPEVIFQGTAFFLGLSPISLVFSAIVLPLFLLWGVTDYVRSLKHSRRECMQWTIRKIRQSARFRQLPKKVSGRELLCRHG